MPQYDSEAGRYYDEDSPAGTCPHTKHKSGYKVGKHNFDSSKDDPAWKHHPVFCLTCNNPVNLAQVTHSDTRYARSRAEARQQTFGCAISVSILALLRTGSFMPVLAPLVYDFCMWFYPRYGRFLEWLPLPQWMEKYRKAIQNFPQVVEHVYHVSSAQDTKEA